MKEIKVTPLSNGQSQHVGPIQDWAVKLIIEVPQPFTVHYTIDGTSPTEKSTIYKGDLIVGGTDVLSDAGILPVRFLLKFDSNTAIGYPVLLLFDRSIELNASVPFGMYAEPQEVALTACTGSTIYYTLNGTDPLTLEGGPSKTAVRYTGAIEVGNTMLKAVAVKDGNYSELLQGKYSLGERTLAICASHLDGEYTSPIAVRLTTNLDDGVAIYYTLDGSSPLGCNAELYDSAVIMGNTPGEVVLRAVATTDKQQSPSITKKYNFKE